jgi:uncharacterized membrane protein YeiH
MPVLNLVGPAQYPLECAGVFAFALSGALLAVGKDFDFFGTVILAGAAGLGGGLFRDLVLGVRPVAFTDVGFYAASAAAALIVFFWTDIRSYDRAWAVFDAAALGLASTTGTIKSLGHGLEPAPAIALGICTAAGGGCLSSLLAHEVPPVLRWDRDLYVLPAFVGAGAVAALYSAHLLSVSSAIGAAFLAFVLRMLSMRYKWRTPRSRSWRRLAAYPAAHQGRRHAAKPRPTAGTVATPARLMPRDGTTLLRPENGGHIPMPEDTMRIRMPGAPLSPPQ